MGERLRESQSGTWQSSTTVVALSASYNSAAQASRPPSPLTRQRSSGKTLTRVSSPMALPCLDSLPFRFPTRGTHLSCFCLAAPSLPAHVDFFILFKNWYVCLGGLRVQRRVCFCFCYLWRRNGDILWCDVCFDWLPMIWSMMIELFEIVVPIKCRLDQVL